MYGLADAEEAAYVGVLGRAALELFGEGGVVVVAGGEFCLSFGAGSGEDVVGVAGLLQAVEVAGACDEGGGGPAYVIDDVFVFLYEAYERGLVGQGNLHGL